MAGKTGNVTLTSGDVGLGNVDNTSDATKNSAAVTLTNKTIDSPQIINNAAVATGGMLSLFNTSDQVTNYERGRFYWNSNVLTLIAEAGGTGTFRNMQISANGTFINLTGSGVVMGRNGTTSNTDPVSLSTATTFGGSSLIQSGVTISPTINQSGTAGYSAVKINPTETATGSGVKNLIQAQVGNTNRFRVDNLGNATISSAATTGLVLYNTSDETTNTERARHYWSSNQYIISTENGGTGVARVLRLTAGTRLLDIGGSSAHFDFQSTTTANVPVVRVSPSLGSTTGVQYAQSIAPSIAQSSTGGYTALLINPTETTTGSGAKNLIDLQVGGSSKAKIDNTGKVTAVGYREGVVNVGTVSTTATISLTNGTMQVLTLTASTACTITPPTLGAGDSCIIYVKQDATTGNGTATFTGVKWPAAGAPTITAAAGKMDIITLSSPDGTNIYGAYSQGYSA